MLPRLNFSALQHLRMGTPFFSTEVFLNRPRNFALFPESAVLRVWLPFLRFLSISHPWGPLSAPNALGLRTTEFFSFLMIEVGFRQRSSALGLPQKTFQPSVGTPAVCSHQESRAPDCYPKV